ncbi:uncharacterized protein LOC134408950 [Elgaria multicarinata webbii]|uniref:uncharacterized protein LOC134408950 n=1 Tax=Elgaria multicarinata webbii TaxID=159646 RepID=UPI002FCD4517
MAQEIDWLNSQAGLCRVDLYKHDVPKDKDCEVVCFIDVSTLNPKERDQNKAKKTTSQSSIVSVSSNDFDLALENLEEKDVIVIKDNERNNAINTVCLFKQGSSEEASVANWLNNDLQKYAAGFKQALSNFEPPRKPKPPLHSLVADKLSQNANTSFQGSDGNLLLIPEFAHRSRGCSGVVRFHRTTGRRCFLFVTGQDGSEAKQEPDFLSTIEGRELQSVRPAPQPKELVIPLIQKNQWKKPVGSVPLQEQDGINGVEAQAVRELIEESKKSQEQWESGTKVDPAFAIPLLMQNHVPDGYEEGEKVDVSLRPESSTDADYEEVPVEAYGLAMLKGICLKAGEGIGRTFKQDVKPPENCLRPKGLGLGTSC